ncbi:Transposase IS3/IS911 family protein [Legionella santicrucis]|uniref:Transposase IS3/IS911 family protein n=1 Tax=Legionella santicrucis TaxID=45074 RepID=A0A0W0YTV5_9GAMM|nr:hypothetical protein [Legionella santicrucis]KTD60312.1 Transposase IS3/IS911 family protein [Legionella santicrucis]
MTQAQLAREYGAHPTQIKAWKQTALQVLADAFSNARDKDKKEQSELVEALYEEIRQLQTQLSWLKKSAYLSLDEKHLLIDSSAEITTREQCMLLRLNVSSYYYKASPISAEDERLMVLLDEHYLQYPCSGTLLSKSFV